MVALSATPGNDRAKVQEVLGKLRVQHVEARTEQDADVRAHVHDKQVEQMVIDLPPAISRLQSLLTAAMRPCIQRLHGLKLIPFKDPGRLSFQVLSSYAAQAG